MPRTRAERDRRLAGALAAVVAGAALFSPGLPAGALVSRAKPAGHVKLLASGSAPRSALRLKLSQGTAVSAQMTLVESIDQKLGGRTLNSGTTPTLIVPIQATVDSVTPDGTAQVSSGYAGASGPVAALAAVKGTETLTPRNEIVDSKVTGTEGLGSTVAQLTSQLSDQLSAFSAPFPKQPVGVGARWQVASTAKVSGLTVHQTYLFRLVRRDATDITLSFQVVQTAARQVAHLPGVPANARVKLSKFENKGTGTMTQRLSEPLPVVSSSHTTGAQTFEVSQQGQHAQLDQTLEVDLHLTRPAT